MEARSSFASLGGSSVVVPFEILLGSFWTPFGPLDFFGDLVILLSYRPDSEGSLAACLDRGPAILSILRKGRQAVASCISLFI